MPKKCACKKRGRPRKVGRAKGSKNKKTTQRKKQNGKGVAGAALAMAKTLAPAIAASLAGDFLVKNVFKKGSGMRLLGRR